MGLPMDATPERDARAGESRGRLHACTVASPQAGPLLRVPARSWTSDSEDKIRQRLRGLEFVITFAERPYYGLL